MGTGAHGGVAAAPGEDHETASSLLEEERATYRVVSDGDWSDESIWADGERPTEGAMVHVPTDVSVRVDDEFSTPLEWLRVDGELWFATDRDTQLRVETVVTGPDSTFLMGTPSDPIQPDATAQLVIADLGPIDEEWDDERMSKGLITMGTTRMCGTEKTSFETLDVHPSADDSTLTLTAEPTNWDVGDRLVIPGVVPPEVENGSVTDSSIEDEEVHIESIDGREVTLDGSLSFDHEPPRDDLNSYVLNLDRNVRIRSENDEIDRRGHVMFMNADTGVFDAGFYDLGRTDKSRPFTNPSNQSHDVSGEPNPKARYALHFHQTGVDPSGEPAIVEGCVVEDSPGWGIVNHGSYVDVRYSITHRVLGAGFVAEKGNEIGTFESNFALRSAGSGEGARSRAVVDGEVFHDFGHGGHGFWLQSPLVDVVDNVAAGHRHNGFTYWTILTVDEEFESSDEYYQQDISVQEQDWARAQHYALPIENVRGQGYFEHAEDDATIPTEVRIHTCRNNTAFASGGGLLIGRNRWDHEHRHYDEYSVIDGFTAYNVGFNYDEDGEIPSEDFDEPFTRGGRGISIWRSACIALTNCTLIGDDVTDGGSSDGGFGGGSGGRREGISLTTQEHHIHAVDSEIVGWDVGMLTGGRGTTAVQRCYFDNGSSVFGGFGSADLNVRVQFWAPQSGVQLDELEFGDGGTIYLEHRFESLYPDGRELRAVGRTPVRLDGHEIYVDLQHPDEVPIPDEDALTPDIGGDAFSMEGLTIEPGVLDNDEEVLIDDLVGLSNREMYEQYGVTTLGEMTPARAVESLDGGPEIVNGVIDPEPGADGTDYFLDVEDAVEQSGYDVESGYDAYQETSLIPNGSADRDAPPESADLRYEMTTEADEYVLWTRMDNRRWVRNEPTPSGNVFFGGNGPSAASEPGFHCWIRVDGGEWIEHTLYGPYSNRGEAMGFTWFRLCDESTINITDRPFFLENHAVQWTADPITLDLEEGEHTVEVAYGSTDLPIDRLLLTSRDVLPRHFGVDEQMFADPPRLPSVDGSELESVDETEVDDQEQTQEREDDRADEEPEPDESEEGPEDEQDDQQEDEDQDAQEGQEDDEDQDAQEGQEDDEDQETQEGQEEDGEQAQERDQAQAQEDDPAADQTQSNDSSLEGGEQPTGQPDSTGSTVDSIAELGDGTDPERLELEDIREAMRRWSQGEPLPNGEEITEAQLHEAIEYWSDNGTVVQ